MLVYQHLAFAILSSLRALAENSAGQLAAAAASSAVELLGEDQM